ncbi:hypothetical protein ACGF5S_28765 [Nocardia nova]|uniref:hypothetical protein n=1 Tax=Nocardia nova TaxID=37330 RepID=UPI00371F39BC
MDEGELSMDTMPIAVSGPRGAIVAIRYLDGSMDSRVVATCDLPCGWSGPAEGRLMTGTNAVLA